MAHDVFISYSSQDKPTADAVCAALESRSIRCWIAPRDVLPGTAYAAALVRAVRESRLMVLIFSSGANQSPQVLRELERAASGGLPIIPMRIEDVILSEEMEYYISSRHWLDALAPPLERHLVRLCETVAQLLSRTADTASSKQRAPAVQFVPPNGAKALEQAEQERLAREGRAREQVEQERLARETTAREEAGHLRRQERKAWEQAKRERIALVAKVREQAEQERIAHETSAREQAEQAGPAHEANPPETTAARRRRYVKIASRLRMRSSTPEEAKASDDAEVAHVLSAYHSRQDYYYQPESEYLLVSARKSCLVPPEELVFAIIDCRALILGNRFIVFGQDNIYFRTGQLNKEYSYSEIRQMRSHFDDTGRLVLDKDLWIDLGRSRFAPADLLDILRKLQAARRPPE